MISFFGRDLQSIDSIEQLVLFTFTLCAVVGIMSLFKHFNMLLVICKKGPPLFSMSIFVNQVFLPKSRVLVATQSL